MHDLYGLNEQELKGLLVEKPYRASQILKWIYEKKASSWEAMTDLSKDFRLELSKNFRINSLKLVRSQDSCDRDTTKFLWQLDDEKLVESVLIRAPERRTVCVSSQVGCAARCAFCASGKKGLMRNLSVAEIVEQVIQIDKQEKVTHVVFMGMGEPFENYDTVIKAIHLLTDIFGLSRRRITVSTVGIVEKIMKFTEEDLKVNLVLSLHAPNQRIRQKIIPYARKYPLEDILSAMLHFARTSGRDITYEYTMLAGINDAKEHAEELSRLLRGHPCTVNLIPYNPIPGMRLNRPEKEVIDEFRTILTDAGIPTTWRYTKGKDIAAACGQLALQESAC